MKHLDPGDRLVALSLLGALVFSPPLLKIFAADARIFGVPLLYVFLFAAWAALIALTALLVRWGRGEPGGDQGETDGPPSPSEG